MDTGFASIEELTKRLQAREFSVRELIQSTLSVARNDQDALNAYISFREQALEDADESDRRFADGRARSLEGIPVAIKDNLVLESEPTTAGSRILSGYRGVFTASAVRRLREAGAIVIGKTNLDEFAMGSSTENSAFGPSRNPWDPSLVPGGSSGGSAVAVAAGHVPVALGSDTGGSIRQPAGFCGIVGMKPTYGRVSRSGLIALASSLDQIGPFGRSVTDVARIYETISGQDPDDATSADQPADEITHGIESGIKGLRIGLPKEFFGVGLQPHVAQVIEKAVQVLKDLGATVTEISLPTATLGLATYYVILPAEASSNLARYDGIRYGFSDTQTSQLIERYSKSRDLGFGPEPKRRIMIGTYVLSAGYADEYYHKAVRVRNEIKEEFHRAFDAVDLLLTPTSPTVPFAIGEKTKDPLEMYLADLYTVPANLAEIPAISVPAGFVDQLPVGLQLMAKRWDEATLFRTAYAFEKATDWATRKPPPRLVTPGKK